LANLAAYHLSWLAAHPQRTAKWLKERLADGFQVHHADGNHANNAPDNLVLIDGNDHLRLHGRPQLQGHRLVEHSRKGGTNSRKYLGKRERKRLAQKAARARWHKPKLIADRQLAAADKSD